MEVDDGSNLKLDTLPYWIFQHIRLKSILTHKICIIISVIYLQGRVGQSVTCLTADPGLEFIKLEFILRLKIKGNDWLLGDNCPQAANHCALFRN